MTTTEPDADFWGEISGVAIHFPIVVEEMNSATLAFSVPIEAARELIVVDGFTVAEVGPDTAMLIVALCDYIRNPWGDYNEVNFALLAHPTGQADRVGAYVWSMPVDQEFTCAAGNAVLGLPKSVEELTVDYTDTEVVFDLAMEGSRVLKVTLPRVPSSGEPVSETTITYSHLDDRPTEVPLTIDLPTGVIDAADVRIELGVGMLADDLWSLGLPTTPDYAAWGEGLTGRFDRPRPV